MGLRDYIEDKIDQSAALDALMPGREKAREEADKSNYAGDVASAIGRAQDDPSLSMFSDEDIRAAAEKELRETVKGGRGNYNQSLEGQLRGQYGLEGKKLFEYASRLSETAEGRRKTEGQVRAERALEILTGAQRGMARSQAGFDTATALRQGSRAAQQSEAVGEEQIGAAAQLAQEQAGASLEQLLIAGEQRAEDKAFAMAQIQQQADAAEGAMFGNVLGGILGAIGGIAGSFGGPGGAAAGAAAGQALGQGFGRWAT